MSKSLKWWDKKKGQILRPIVNLFDLCSIKNFGLAITNESDICIYLEMTKMKAQVFYQENLEKPWALVIRHKNNKTLRHELNSVEPLGMKYKGYYDDHYATWQEVVAAIVTIGFELGITIDAN